jgi:hypothetical protein
MAFLEKIERPMRRTPYDGKSKKHRRRNDFFPTSCRIDSRSEVGWRKA